MSGRLKKFYFAREANEKFKNIKIYSSKKIEEKMADCYDSDNYLKFVGDIQNFTFSKYNIENEDKIINILDFDLTETVVLKYFMITNL